MFWITLSPIHSRTFGILPIQPYSSLLVVELTVVATRAYWLSAWPRPSWKDALNATPRLARLLRLMIKGTRS